MELFFLLLAPAPSWTQPFAGRICHVAPEKSQTSLNLPDVAFNAFSAAKVLRLTHTQGRDELPSEILQPCG
jgi:hypothetical protein